MLTLGLAIRIKVGDDKDLRLACVHVLGKNVALDFPPAAPQGDVMLVVESLIAKHQQLMPQERIAKSRKWSVLDGSCQVHVEDFGTQHRTERTQFKFHASLLRHFLLLRPAQNCIQYCSQYNASHILPRIGETRNSAHAQTPALRRRPYRHLPPPPTAYLPC